MSNRSFRGAERVAARIADPAAGVGDLFGNLRGWRRTQFYCGFSAAQANEDPPDTVYGWAGWLCAHIEDADGELAR